VGTFSIRFFLSFPHFLSDHVAHSCPTVLPEDHLSFVSEVNSITWFSSHLFYSLGNTHMHSFQESSKGLSSGFFTYCYFYSLFFLLKHHSTWPTCCVARCCKPRILLKTGFSHSNIKLFLTANYSTAPESNTIDSCSTEHNLPTLLP